MIEQVGVGVAFYAFFVASKVGKTGLTVTADVWRITEAGTATEVVSGGSATEIGDGLYRYGLAGASVTAAGEYIAVFKTSDSTVDVQHIPAIWTVGHANIEYLDAAASTLLPTASYVAPLDATATQNAAEAALTAYDAATVTDVAGVPDNLLDNEEASPGVTIRQAIAASGSAADPLLNSLGGYPDDTGGGALQKINNIADAVLYGPAILDNTMELADASQGSRRPGQSLTWLDASGVPVNLTGATVTGAIRSRKTGTARAITGTLTVTDAASGVFTWAYSEADVADAGDFDVQFTAAYSAGVTPAKTFVAAWRVRGSIEVPA